MGRTKWDDVIVADWSNMDASTRKYYLLTRAVIKGFKWCALTLIACVGSCTYLTEKQDAHSAQIEVLEKVHPTIQKYDAVDACIRACRHDDNTMPACMSNCVEMLK